MAPRKLEVIFKMFAKVLMARASCSNPAGYHVAVNTQAGSQSASICQWHMDVQLIHSLFANKF